MGTLARNWLKLCFASKFIWNFSKKIVFKIWVFAEFLEQLFYRLSVMVKVLQNGNTRTICEICLKLTIKIPERRCSCFFIVNFEHVFFCLVASSLVVKFMIEIINKNRLVC